MSDKTSLLALDWGTSTLRACRLGADGAVLESRARPWGILSLPEGGFAAAYLAITEGWRRPGLVAIASGMVGSRQGWREVAYHALPCDPDALAAGLPTVQTGDGALHLVPGLLDPAGPDVMRGEETEALGALERLGRPSGRLRLVMPGTHSKWLGVADGRLTGFATAMTGELFALLSTRSILSRGLEDAPPPDRQAAEAAFAEGVRAGNADGLSARLFSLRARLLTGALPASLVRDTLSGLLIGDELRAMAGGADGIRTVLVGEAALTDRYARAFAALGLAAPDCLADAAPRGLFRIATMAGLLGRRGESSC